MRTNRSVPNVTVIPQLSYPDVGAAVEWLVRVFGFSLRIGMGNHRAQLNVGPDGAVVVRELPGGEPLETGQSVMIRVENVDSHHARAVREGATIVQPPADHPYGERQYGVRDLAGYVWKFTESIADVAPEEWGGTPGRIESGATTYASASDLASAMRRAEVAHGEHEKRTGVSDANWPAWYAAYMVAEQAGTPLPT